MAPYPAIPALSRLPGIRQQYLRNRPVAAQRDRTRAGAGGDKGQTRQFTVRALVSRYDVLTLTGRAAWRTVLLALDAITKRIPFPIRAMREDGGSESMSEFEEACSDRGNRLTGAMERANRTHQEEFYQTSTANLTVEAMGKDLARWEKIYNTVRPHQALGHLTPRQFLDPWNLNHRQKGGGVAYVAKSKFGCAPPGRAAIICSLRH